LVTTIRQNKYGGTTIRGAAVGATNLVFCHRCDVNKPVPWLYNVFDFGAHCTWAHVMRDPDESGFVNNLCVQLC
jgi:hypothetical protein